MIMRVLILITLLLLPLQAKAANPGFDLVFVFKPAVPASSTAIPTVFLDVCSNQNCTTVAGTATLICEMRSTGVNGAIGITRCGVHAVVKPRQTDPNVALLGRPGYLRLRENSAVSVPFYFQGGAPVVPNPLFKYLVTPGPTGFTVGAI